MIYDLFVCVRACAFVIKCKRTKAQIIVTGQASPHHRLQFQFLLSSITLIVYGLVLTAFVTFLCVCYIAGVASLAGIHHSIFDSVCIGSFYKIATHLLFFVLRSTVC